MDVKSQKNDEVVPVLQEDGKNICRDFLRNVCHRGRRCKFKHSSPEELDEIVDVSTSGISYEFCHDFQNSQCQRSNCRFIHCTKEEEDNYLLAKTLPLRLKYQYDFGIGDFFLGKDKSHSDSSLIFDVSGRPVCRDFLNRDCHRGKKCKFAHVDHNQIVTTDNEKRLHHEGGVKRPRILVEEDIPKDSSEYCNLRSNHAVVNCFPNSKHLEEENQNLKKRVEELEKQVSDLAATNEVLLEQNAQFRLQKRGLTNYVHSTEGLSASSFAPGTGMNTPVAASTHSHRAVPVQLNVQVTGQPPVPEIAEFIPTPSQELIAAGPASQRTVVAPNPLHQGSVSVSQTSEIAAQVLAANIAVNSSGKMEMISAIPQPNPQLAQPQLSQLPPQPMASFSGPGQTPHNPMVQQPMASFAPAMPAHNQLTGQQAVSFAGISAAINGGSHYQTASVPGDIRQSGVGSINPAVPLPQSALVYTVTRTTDNMPLVSTIIPATRHEVALVTERPRNPVSSMPASLHVPPHGVQQQAFSSVPTASQALVQAPSHQNNEIVPGPPARPCAPMTSAIGGASKQMSPVVSRGAVHPAVQSPRVNGGQRTVVQGASSLSDPSMITYPINAVAQPQLHS